MHVVREKKLLEAFSLLAVAIMQFLINGHGMMNIFGMKHIAHGDTITGPVWRNAYVTKLLSHTKLYLSSTMHSQCLPCSISTPLEGVTCVMYQSPSLSLNRQLAGKALLYTLATVCSGE